MWTVKDIEKCFKQQSEYIVSVDARVYELTDRIAALEAGQRNMGVGPFGPGDALSAAGQRREEPRVMAVRQMISLEETVKAQRIAFEDMRENYQRQLEEVAENLRLMSNAKIELLDYTAKLVKAARGTKMCQLCHVSYVKEQPHEDDCPLADVPLAVLAKLEKEEKRG